MADTTDVLLKFCEQQWTEAKQAEDQRATITNLTLLVTSAIVGVFTQKSMSKGLLPLSVLVTFLGIFGATISRKLYERHEFHIERLRHLRDKIAELHPEAQLDKIRESATEIHSKRFSVTSDIHLNHLWTLLHLTIALAGIVLTIVIAVHR